jgi:hypothetical protein
VLDGLLATLPEELDWAVELRHQGFHAGGSHERACRHRGRIVRRLTRATPAPFPEMGTLATVDGPSTPTAEKATTAGRQVAAIALIPFLSVSSVALLSDMTARSNPAGFGPGLLATLIGVVTGLLVLRLVRSVTGGLRLVSDAVARWCEAASTLATTGSALLSRRPILVPLPATLPTAVRRRGPPVVLR